MSIQVGDQLPAGKLQELILDDSPGCAMGPSAIDVRDALKGKTVVIFGLPGAYTPTCSAKHAPGYIDAMSALKDKGVDEVWCLSVNDAFVMGAWGRDLKAQGKVRMLADGSANYSKALGLELDLTEAGMGMRCQRFSMLVKDGVVQKLNVEASGKFEVSDAQTM
ncbi:MAG TPA: peroxiredoxin, partial [Burkholderiaceae bacterium]|nr:peroxiredoxin [Burkholderiaceae bacterium]